MQLFNPSASSPQPLQLRPYQRDIISAVENSNSLRQLIIAGTGTGKTFMAANIIKRALALGKKVFFYPP
nr:DEAD/DEAH box helicase family protein [Crocosphaera watsonii]